MKNKLDLFILEDYLDGKLSMDQKQAIEEEIQNNQSLADELDALKISREAIELAGWKSTIQDVQASYLSERKEKPSDGTKTISNFQQWSIRVAASMTILLVGLASFLVISTTPQGVNEDFLSYNIPVMRGESAEISSLKKAFNESDFEEVVALAKANSDLTIEGKFILGMAFLQLGEGKLAVDELREIETINESSSEKMYVEEIDYYLMQGYLLSGEYDLAQNQLEKIRSNPRHKYHQTINRWDALKIKILDLKY